jgi:hypothetical protein
MSIRIPVRGLGGAIVAHALVDEDNAALADFLWRLDRDGYAIRGVRHANGRRTTRGMHREVLGLGFGDGLMSDHIDHDRLNNTRANLRVVTNAENQQNRAGASSLNSSGLRGVARHRSGKWRAYVGHMGRVLYLGLYPTPRRAAEVAAAKRHELGFLSAGGGR